MAADSKTELRETGQPPDQEQNIQPSPPPDGGFWAWVQCLTGFCVFFNTFGLLNSFGTFQTYYERESLRNSSSSQISWIGTVQSSFILLGSIYAGPLLDWGYVQPLVWAGSVMLVLGMFMTSLCTEYWQTLLAQGFLMGLGMGCLFTPATGIIAQYFARRRGLALGIVSSGSTIGGIIYPVMFHKLVGRSGFGWSTRIMAFVIFGTMVLPVLATRIRIKPPAARRIFDSSVWKEAQYTLFAISFFLGYVGLYIPFFYIQLYCADKTIITGEFNFYLLPIMNASGFFGRLGIGHLADRVGPLRAFIMSSAACAILVFGWIRIENEAGVVIFCILYGFFSSGMITLPATVIAAVLCPDVRQYGVRFTMQCAPAGVGLLIGNPIAGAILRKGGWVGLQGFSGATVIGCTVFGLITLLVGRR
ncbi:putative monocarboxylate transporter [Periconia macrospinosa]|uniref:Putative monocarboxylate transporter n=1 Tax=Periconia macrospinosa TaxID=97972 RepID=A0A2V1DG12_9PLEO|nr:putative monocarboxylate transporter [Periconia macrospinosa]